MRAAKNKCCRDAVGTEEGWAFRGKGRRSLFQTRQWGTRFNEEKRLQDSAARCSGGKYQGGRRGRKGQGPATETGAVGPTA